MIALFLMTVCCLYQAFTGEVIIKREDSLLIAFIGESIFELIIATSKDKDTD